MMVVIIQSVTMTLANPVQKTQRHYKCSKYVKNENFKNNIPSKAILP